MPLATPNTAIGVPRDGPSVHGQAAVNRLCDGTFRMGPLGRPDPRRAGRGIPAGNSCTVRCKRGDEASG